MKFAPIYSLAFTIVLSLGALSCQQLQKKDLNEPANTGIKITNKQTTLKIDTVTITNEMLDKRILAAGVFKSYNGEINISYFEPGDSTSRVKNFCQTNNNQMTLIMRHELEHARKENLTKNTNFFDPLTRGAIAAQNEIIAPAAEIIEALDYRYENDTVYPTNKLFILKADKKITQIAKEQKLDWPIDFNNQQIADVVMACATEHFFKETQKGLYIATIKKEMGKKSLTKSYQTNNLCSFGNAALFNPKFGIWSPLWQFESKRGSVNIWEAASINQKRKNITLIDSLTNKIAGQNPTIFLNLKTH